jgi:hypothetical protein
MKRFPRNFKKILEAYHQDKQVKFPLPAASDKVVREKCASIRSASQRAASQKKTLPVTMKNTFSLLTAPEGQRRYCFGSACMCKCAHIELHLRIFKQHRSRQLR